MFIGLINCLINILSLYVDAECYVRHYVKHRMHVCNARYIIHLFHDYDTSLHVQRYIQLLLHFYLEYQLKHIKTQGLNYNNNWCVFSGALYAPDPDPAAIRFL